MTQGKGGPAAARLFWQGRFESEELKWVRGDDTPI